MTADDIPAWDSITHIQLIFAVEEEFGIRLTMQDLESLDDVGALRGADRPAPRAPAAGRLVPARPAGRPGWPQGAGIAP